MRPGILLPFLAILLQVVTIAAIYSTLAVDILLSDSDYSSIYAPSIQTGIIAGLTIGGTIITTFTIGQVRSLWVRTNARHQALNLTIPIVTTRKTIVQLGLAGFVDQIKAADVTLTLLVMGLVTTGLVAALTPKLVVGKLD